MSAAGFEPTPPNRSRPERGVSDHLAKPSDVLMSGLFLKTKLGGAGGGWGLSHKKEIHDKVTDLWIRTLL